jgi:hypothetical protein
MLRHEGQPPQLLPPSLTPLDRAPALGAAEAPDLLNCLAAVPGPRAQRGRRYPQVSVLALDAAAVLAGARSMTATAEWAADVPQPALVALGVRRNPLTGHRTPLDEATIRRILAHLDAEALAAAIGT